MFEYMYIYIAPKTGRVRPAYRDIMPKFSIILCKSCLSNIVLELYVSMYYLFIYSELESMLSYLADYNNYKV